MMRQPCPDSLLVERFRFHPSSFSSTHKSK